MKTSESGFRVTFSSEVARILECDDAAGRISFTTDSGPGGDKSICLEHHPADWPRDHRYDNAFEAARQFLVSCGYQVEIYGK